MLFVWALLIALILAYISVVPQFRPREQRTIVNSGLTLAAASLGQTMVVLTGGIDLSIGPMVSLTNSIAFGHETRRHPEQHGHGGRRGPGRWRARGLINGHHGGLWALAADHRHPGDRLDLDRNRALYPALTWRLHSPSSSATSCPARPLPNRCALPCGLSLGHPHPQGRVRRRSGW